MRFAVARESFGSLLALATCAGFAVSKSIAVSHVIGDATQEDGEQDEARWLQTERLAHQATAASTGVPHAEMPSAFTHHLQEVIW